MIGVDSENQWTYNGCVPYGVRLDVGKKADAKFMLMSVSKKIGLAQDVHFVSRGCQKIRSRNKLVRHL